MIFYRTMTWAGLCGGLFLRIGDQAPISPRPVFFGHLGSDDFYLGTDLARGNVCQQFLILYDVCLSQLEPR